MLDAKTDIQIQEINITKGFDPNEEIVSIRIWNFADITAHDVTIDISIDIPIYDYWVNSKEEYIVKWGGKERNSLGLYFSELYGHHRISVTLFLRSSFLQNYSVEPTVQVYEGKYGLVASHYAPAITG